MTGMKPMTLDEESRLELLESENKELREDILTLKSTLRSDEEQFRQWARRHAEMRDDVIKTAQQRDEVHKVLKAVLDVVKLAKRHFTSTPAWSGYGDIEISTMDVLAQLDSAIAQAAAVLNSGKEA